MTADRVVLISGVSWPRLCVTLLPLIELVGCGRPAPRDDSLPPWTVIADFSARDQPLREYAVRYGTYDGSPSSLFERSTAVSAILEVDGRPVLLVDYKLGARLTAVGFCGLWIDLRSTAKRKDWSAVACELRAAPGSDPVAGVRIEAKLSDGYYASGVYRVASESWCVCVVPITWGDAGTPDEEQHFTQLVISFASGITTPKTGRVMVRRVYLLKSEHDLPDALREGVGRYPAGDAP